MYFKANGKLMLFGEYLVIRGSGCLAIPLKFNQDINIQKSKTPFYFWRSKELGNEWFFVQLNRNLEVVKTSDSAKGKIIQQLLKIIFEKRTDLFHQGLTFEINSNFRRDWGLGSSSTLISLLSQWSGVDPYELLDKSFGGSGYDIACATSATPVLYKVRDRIVKRIELPKNITSQLLFIYSGNKQSSRSEIAGFNDSKVLDSHIQKMNEIIGRATGAENIEEFESCMEESEILLKNILNRKRIKSVNFADYPYAIKSLGAWGGDFFMASFRGEKEARAYFDKKNLTTQFSYAELIYR